MKALGKKKIQSEKKKKKKKFKALEGIHHRKKIN